MKFPPVYNLVTIEEEEAEKEGEKGIKRVHPTRFRKQRGRLGLFGGRLKAPRIGFSKNARPPNPLLDDMQIMRKSKYPVTEHESRKEELVIHGNTLFNPSNLAYVTQLAWVLHKANLDLIAKGDIDTTLNDFLNGIFPPLTKGFKEFLIGFVSSGWGFSREQIAESSAYYMLQYLVLGNDRGKAEWLEIDGGGMRQATEMMFDLNNIRPKEIKISRVDKTYHKGECRYKLKLEDGSYQQNRDGTGPRLYQDVVLTGNAIEITDCLEDLQTEDPLLSDVLAALREVEYCETRIAIYSVPVDERQKTYVVNTDIPKDPEINARNTVIKPWHGEIVEDENHLKWQIIKQWLRPGEVLPESTAERPVKIAVYKHPIMNAKYIRAQRAIQRLHENNSTGIWITGMMGFMGPDSANSAMMASIRAAAKMKEGNESEALQSLVDLTNQHRMDIASSDLPRPSA